MMLPNTGHESWVREHPRSGGESVGLVVSPFLDILLSRFIDIEKVLHKTEVCLENVQRTLHIQVLQVLIDISQISGSVDGGSLNLQSV